MAEGLRQQHELLLGGDLVLTRITHLVARSNPILFQVRRGRREGGGADLAPAGITVVVSTMAGKGGEVSRSGDFVTRILGDSLTRILGDLLTRILGDLVTRILGELVT